MTVTKQTLTAKLLITGCLLAVAASVAFCDVLVLDDGRKITGTVTVEKGTVFIETTYGTFIFPASKVARIEKIATPKQRFETKLANTPQDDTKAMFKLAKWADSQSLTKEAKEVYEKILILEPDHAATRKRLGYTKIDKKWYLFDKGMQLARSKLEAGQYNALLTKVLPALAKIAKDPKKQIEVRELLGYTQLRAKRFAAAAGTFKALATQADPPAKIRYEAISQILSDNPDGMYVLKEKYPPDADLRGKNVVSLPAGPASLAQPLALEAALTDRAKTYILAGRTQMAEAKKLQSTNPNQAKARHLRARREFDHADALCQNITRSYRIEIVRRQIAALRRDADGNARKFDKLMESLGRRGMSPEEYKNTLVRMTHHLDSVRDDIKEILAASKPYVRELVLEIKWAQLDLKRIEEMRQVLKKELHGKG